MEYRIRTARLRRLAKKDARDAKLPAEVCVAYRNCIALIAAATDLRDLRALPGRHFKKLGGKRAHQHSMRLNDQWRLIIEIEKGKPARKGKKGKRAQRGTPTRLHLVSVEDYH